MNQILQNSQKWQAIRQKLASHITNRQKIRQIYKDKGIQMLGEPELIFSDIEEKPLDLEKSLIYNAIKSELNQMGFIDFRYLAQGKQGYVILAKQGETNKRFAIKGIPIRDMHGTILKDNLDQAKKEVEMLQKCKGCPYIVNLLGQIEGKSFFYLILNECQGTLTDILKKSQDERLNELSTIKYSTDIAEGLSFMHEKKCICNDLKMDNILIDYNGNAVVSDLGLADSITKTSGFGTSEYMGNLFFQAPECYDSKVFHLYSDKYKKLEINVQQEPSTKSESFSLGYLIYAMIQGNIQNCVFKKHKPLKYNNQFQQLTYQQQLKDIIDGLTQFVPSDRLSIKQALVMLREIVSIEFQLSQNFIEVIEDDELSTTQQTISQFNQDIEFIQCYSNHFYPIIQNEKAFLTEISLNPDNGNMKQEKVLEELQMSNIYLTQKVQQQEITIQDLQKKQDSTIAELQKANNLLNFKVQQQDEAILSLQKKQENTQAELINANNSLNLKIQQQDQVILDIQKQQETAFEKLQKANCYLTLQVQQQDKTILDLQAKNETRLTELQQFNNSITQKLNEQDQRNNNQLNQLQKQEATIDELSKTILFLKQKQQDHDQSKLELQARIEDLQSQITLLNQQQQEKDQIYSKQQDQIKSDQFNMQKKQEQISQQMENFEMKMKRIRMEGFLDVQRNKVYDINKKQIGMINIRQEFNRNRKLKRATPLFNNEMTQYIGNLYQIEYQEMIEIEERQIDRQIDAELTKQITNFHIKQATRTNG